MGRHYRDVRHETRTRADRKLLAECGAVPQRKRMSARKRVLIGSASVLAIGGAGVKRGEYHTVYNGDGTRVTFYTKVK